MSLRMALCASATDRNKYFSLWFNHFHEHKMELLGGAMPVFIAATIAEAVSATFLAITKNNDNMVIWLSVVWALVVCQALAYYVVYFLPKDLSSYNFWYRISMENCAFAWKEVLYLIIYYKYMYMYSPPQFTLIWVGFLVMCAFLVGCTGLLQERLTGTDSNCFLVQLTRNTILKAKILNAEIYSLGLAYTLNLITLAGTCGPNFLSSIKYDDDHYSHGSNPMCYPALILYPLIVTSVITVLHSMGLFDTAAELVEEGEKGEVEHEIDAMLFRQSEAELEHANSHEFEGNIGGSRQQKVEEVQEDKLEHKKFDDIYTRAGGALTACCTPLDSLFCSWDQHRTVSISISMFLYVLLGLYCGSAWFVYALLQFRFLFQGSDAMNYFVFSVTITAISLVYVTSMSTKHQWDHHYRLGKARRWTNTKSKRKELITMAAR